MDLQALTLTLTLTLTPTLTPTLPLTRWSEELEIETPDPGPGKREPEVVPKAWLRMSVPDVMAECCEQAWP